MPSIEEQPPPSRDDDDPGVTPEQESAFRALGELSETPLSSFTTEITVDSASELFQRLRDWPLCNQQWVFRGHSSSSWNLSPSIERLGEMYKGAFRSDAEQYVRRTFKRRAHHYLQILPDDEDELEWLALMRHHGTPTRLLDWTRSPYVAAFFATAEAREQEASAIWAIDIRQVAYEASRLLGESGTIEDCARSNFSFSSRDTFNAVFMKETYPAIVAPVQPFRTNERVTSQQGLFLCHNSSLWGFELGLKQVLKSYRDRAKEYLTEQFGQDSDPPESLFKIVIAPSARGEILRELHRMNINYETLFPGLDGFARSLSTTVTISTSFVSDEDLDRPI